MSKRAPPCLLECSGVTKGNDANGVYGNAKVLLEKTALRFPQNNSNCKALPFFPLETLPK